MKKAMQRIRKVLVLLFGVPLFIIGIILIPLPGPGLIVCFLALLLLSLEFDWADKQFQRIKSEVIKIYRRSKEKADAFEKKYTDKLEKRSKKK